MDWTFVSAVQPDSQLCETLGKCKQAVQALSHDVTLNDDGSVTIQASHRHSGDGMTIDRPDQDETFILGEIDGFLDGAQLVHDGSHATLSNAGRTVDLVPASVDDLLDAIFLVRSFEQSFAKLDQCGVRQVLDILNRSGDRAAHAQEVADAARYLGHLGRLETSAQYYVDGAPADQEAELRQKQLVGMYAAMALNGPRAEIALAGSPLSDEQVLEAARKLDGALKPVLGDSFANVSNDLLVDRKAGFLATVRLMSRFDVLLRQGNDPYTAICKDITFTQ